MHIKILHFIGQMERGGAERQLLHIAEALRERGWTQAVVTFNPGEIWDNRLIKAGIPLMSIPRDRNKFWRLWRLCAIIQRTQPLIVHSWSNHTNVYARWTLSYPKPRLIVSFRGNPTVNNFTGKPIRRIPNPRVYESADCVISNSRAALEAALGSGVRINRGEIVSNIVAIRSRANPGENVAVPRIVAAGILIPRKAYDVLLLALSRLAADGHRFELFLAGDGPERTHLEDLATQLRIGHCVKFLGSIEDVPALLSTAHLLVHPSRSEGLSNTIIEAMAEGLPVVVTNVGGTSDLIIDGISGLIVPPDEPEILAAKIRDLLDNPSLRWRLGVAGLESIRERCSIESVASHYERIYQSILYRDSQQNTFSELFAE
jgi:glycosyltransferase involved in cell wall biosynthesis